MRCIPGRTVLATVVSFALWVLPANAADTPPAGKPELGNFGIDLTARDASVKPGDDFNRYVSGHWLDAYQLKDYETAYGPVRFLRDRTETRVRAILEELANTRDVAPGSDAQKVRDYYASHVDRARRDAAGITPLRPILDRIARIRTRADLVAAFGNADLDASNAPFEFDVNPDRKDPSQYLVSIDVGGLGLPDRDYYLNPEPRFAGIRTAYLAHIERMLGLAGVKDAKTRADAILALETDLARPQWDRAQLRDRDKTYNVETFQALRMQYPGFDWAAFARAAGMPALDRVNDTTPSAVQPIIDVIARTPLPVWRDYLAFHAVSNNAPLLSRQIDDAAFAFTGTVLNGQTAQREDWKRAVATAGGMDGLGDAVGKLYAERHFEPEAKTAMLALVGNVRSSMRQAIAGSTWMSDATKAEAFHKLETFRPMIGYPEKWRDYSGVTMVPDDLMANTLEMRRYWRNDSVRRIGTQPDRFEWWMTPHTVNAYYNPSFNVIVFPAARLQAPNFDVHADAAVNYGAIGAVIGHEMGHGFDDQGSKSDFAGIQRNWWTDADRANFDARTKALAAQYDAFCPIKDTCVNGALTLGENIGDLNGLSVAFAAYHLSLDGNPAPIIDGVTGDQRFFMAYAQMRNEKFREEFLVNQLKTDPHSPGRYRINGAVRNFDPWYAAFDVKPGDALYLPPEQRVRIW
jgi:predicted metalloendopeptidase